MVYVYAQSGASAVSADAQSGGKILLFDGTEGISPNVEWSSDIDWFNSFEVVWQYITTHQSYPLAPPPCEGETVVVGGSSGEVIMFGGIGSDGTPFGDTWAYTP